MPPEDFSEYRRLILTELERLNTSIMALATKLELFRNVEISSLQVQVAMLQVRAGLFGAIGGAIGGAIVVALITKVLGGK